MTVSRITLPAAVLALLAATSARADWGVRGGLEAPLVTHVNGGGSFNISDSIQPGIDVLVLKGPSDLIALGGELRIGFAGTNNITRTGTTIGPALTLNLPVLPLYARAAVPIRVEPEFLGLGLRLAAGIKLNLPVIGFYLEFFGDMPLAGKTVSGADAKAFDPQTLGMGAGVELRL